MNFDMAPSHLHYVRNGCASFTDFAPVIRDRSALNDSRKSDALPLARDLYFLHFVKFYDARFYFTL